MGCIETSWTWFVLSNNDLTRGIAIYKEIYKEATAYLIPWGGGVLSLEKGTDCGPTATELCLLLAKVAKREGLSSHYECA